MSQASSTSSRPFRSLAACFAHGCAHSLILESLPKVGLVETNGSPHSAATYCLCWLGCLTVSCSILILLMRISVSTGANFSFV